MRLPELVEIKHVAGDGWWLRWRGQAFSVFELPETTEPMIRKRRMDQLPYVRAPLEWTVLYVDGSLAKT